MTPQSKLVSVVTPVYNGAAYLNDCIESVLRQTYGHFEYLIVDNCSTDSSYEIAQAAAAADSRVKVIHSDDHVGLIHNWNRSLLGVATDSEYIKFVHADDWLFPDCIEKMVNVANAAENVGIVSAYRLEEDIVSLDRLPSNASLNPGNRSFTMDGRAVARAVFLERASVLGSPTSILLRTKLVQASDPFFSTEYLHADKDACMRLLQDCEFGFVRQVLTFTRRHNESVTSFTNALDTRRQENLLLLRKFGSVFLSEIENRRTMSREIRSYYQFLARNVGTGKGRDFWSSHKKNLKKAGSPLSRSRLARAFLRRWLNPSAALKELRRARDSSNIGHQRKTREFLDMSRTDRLADDEQKSIH